MSELLPRKNRETELNNALNDLRNNPPELPIVGSDNSEFTPENLLLTQQTQTPFPIPEPAAIPYRQEPMPITLGQQAVDNSDIVKPVDNSVLSQVSAKIKAKALDGSIKAGLSTPQNRDLANGVMPSEITSSSEEDKIKYAIANPSNEDALTRANRLVNEQLGQFKQQRSVGDNFLDALSYFAPTIVAGLGGALVGGAEAGNRSAQAANELNKGFLDYQLKKQKELEQDPLKRAALVARFAEADTAAKAQANLEKYRGQTELYRNNESNRKANQFNVTSAQADKRLGIAAQNAGIAALKSKGLSDNQAKDLGESVAMHAEASKLMNDLNKPELSALIGPLSGRANATMDALGKNNPDYANIVSKLKNITIEKGHAMFGARLTEPEIAQLNILLPKMTDTLPNFKVKLQNYMSAIKDKMEEKAAIAKEAQPIRAETIDKTLKSYFGGKPSKADIQAEIERRRAAGGN